MAHWKALCAILVATLGFCGAERGFANAAAPLKEPEALGGGAEPADGPRGEVKEPVWHPLRSGCFREVLGQSATDWTRSTPEHEGATSTSSIRFWRDGEGHAEVVVIDSGGSVRLSNDGTPFVVVASGAWDRTCVERVSPDTCPEAAVLREALLDHRVRIGDHVADDGRMTLALHGQGYTVEVMDAFANRNRWFFSDRHPDYPVMRERFTSMDRCFARVREAMGRWAADPKAAPPQL